jgi:hypothetical protein
MKKQSPFQSYSQRRVLPLQTRFAFGIRCRKRLRLEQVWNRVLRPYDRSEHLAAGNRSQIVSANAIEVPLSTGHRCMAARDSFKAWLQYLCPRLRAGIGVNGLKTYSVLTSPDAGKPPARSDEGRDAEGHWPFASRRFPPALTRPLPRHPPSLLQPSSNRLQGVPNPKPRFRWSAYVYEAANTGHILPRYHRRCLGVHAISR